MANRRSPLRPKDTPRRRLSAGTLPHLARNLTKSGKVRPDWPRAAKTKTKQTVKFAFGNGITLAGKPFEFSPVDNRYLSSPIVDNLPGLQPARNFRHTASPNAKHHSEKFLGKQKLVGLDAIVGHQEPSAAPLVKRVEVGASSRLRYLTEKSVCVVQHHRAH
jgi:hypothetical protein